MTETAREWTILSVLRDGPLPVKGINAALIKKGFAPLLLGTGYLTMDRLEAKGFVVSEMTFGEPNMARAIRVYKLKEGTR